MNPLSPNLPYFFLKPGDMAISEEPSIIATLLGSCVAVTMISRTRGIGAVCHALLPSCKDKGQCHRCLERFRHVDCAISGMFEEFRQRGATMGSIEVKLFGGADMFRSQQGTDSRNSVGWQNIDRAMEVLEGKGIRPASVDVGGVQGRKILFNTGSGEVFLRRLNSIGNRQVLTAPRRSGRGTR